MSVTMPLIGANFYRTQVQLSHELLIKPTYTAYTTCNLDDNLRPVVSTGDSISLLCRVICISPAAATEEHSASTKVCTTYCKLTLRGKKISDILFM